MREIINPQQKRLYVSIVTLGEIYSIALRNSWKPNKLDTLNAIMEDVSVIDVSTFLLSTYSQLDTYSQRVNPNFSSYPFSTPRNMGKNDLWIASTASLLGLQLVTTDQDFDHLDGTFIDLRRIDPADLKQYYK
jgi:tRNA(fMet)-specific endonuclease VapC